MRINTGYVGPSRWTCFWLFHVMPAISIDNEGITLAWAFWYVEIEWHAINTEKQEDNNE